MGNFNTNKILQGTKILEKEFISKQGFEMFDSIIIISNDNYVINVNQNKCRRMLNMSYEQ